MNCKLVNAAPHPFWPKVLKVLEGGFIHFIINLNIMAAKILTVGVVAVAVPLFLTGCGDGGNEMCKFSLHAQGIDAQCSFGPVSSKCCDFFTSNCLYSDCTMSYDTCSQDEGRKFPQTPDEIQQDCSLSSSEACNVTDAVGDGSAAFSKAYRQPTITFGEAKNDNATHTVTV